MEDFAKKRVTKGDKKAKKGVYTQKHVRLVEELLKKNPPFKDSNAVQSTD